VRLVREARAAAPAVLYLPHLPAWWEQAPPALRAALWMLLRDLPADLPLLLLATADALAADVDDEARPSGASDRHSSCRRALASLRPSALDQHRRTRQPLAYPCGHGGPRVPPTRVTRE
jgi:hypothetical protein